MEMAMSRVSTVATGTRCSCCGRRDGLRHFEARDHTGDGRVSIVACTYCSIAWQWPVAGDAVVESVKFFNAVYDTEQTETAEENDYFDPGNKRAISKLQMDFVQTLTGKTGNLGDVGAGTGFFVAEALSRGWRAMGVSQVSL